MPSGSSRPPANVPLLMRQRLGGIGSCSSRAPRRLAVAWQTSWDTPADADAFAVAAQAHGHWRTRDRRPRARPVRVRIASGELQAPAGSRGPRSRHRGWLQPTRGVVRPRLHRSGAEMPSNDRALASARRVLPRAQARRRSRGSLGPRLADRGNRHGTSWPAQWHGSSTPRLLGHRAVLDDLGQSEDGSQFKREVVVQRAEQRASRHQVGSAPCATARRSERARTARSRPGSPPTASWPARYRSIRR